MDRKNKTEIPSKRINQTEKYKCNECGRTFRLSCTLLYHKCPFKIKSRTTN